MAKSNEFLFGLNAGGVDREALSRVDLEKLRLAGEHPVRNWWPRVLGPMGIRPGMIHVAPLSARTRLVPFVRDSSTTALLAFQDQALLIYQDDAQVPIVTSSSTIANPTFSSALSSGFTTGWKDDSETGAGTVGVASVSGGVLTLTATPYRSASVQQSVAIAGGDQAKAHTVRIVVTRGPVYVRMGTAQDAEDLLTETRLTTGVHKLTVTPGAAALWIKIRSEDAAVARIVTQCQFEHTILGGAGVLSFVTPWTEARLPYLSWDQSADVMFIADGVAQPRRLERRGPASWSLVIYQTRAGPLTTPTTDKLRLTPSARTGNGTLTSSLPYFKPSHIGTLFELTHNEVTISAELTGINQVSDYVTVRGLYNATLSFPDRNVTLDIDVTTGSFVGTITWERSVDPDAAVWSKAVDYTTDQVGLNYNDQQSNILVHYRFRVTGYTSGYVTVSARYKAGTKTGLARVTTYSSSTSVGYEVVKALGDTTAAVSWRGPTWSDDLGWPRVPRLFDGRLWWFRGDTAYGSIVDDYDHYDDTREGDSAPVIRSIGSGPAEGARWALDMQRLIVGTSGFEASIRSSSFDEPITPTAFTVRNASTLGVSYVPAAKVDRGAVFVQRAGRRLYELKFASETNDYTSEDISRLVPNAFSAGIVDMAVQRQPDTRIHLVLSDGDCVTLTYERDDKVIAYTSIWTGLYSSSDSQPDWGALDPFSEREPLPAKIESVAVLPGETSDRVYFAVNRGAGNVRALEKLADERDQVSTATCTLLDSATVLTGPVSAISGATRFAGHPVHVYADGAYVGQVTIDGSGNATLPATYTRVVYGRRYWADFKSVKLAYAAQLGTAIGQEKIVKRVGLVLSNSVLDGLSVGKDAGNLHALPPIIDGAARTAGQFFTHFDHPSMAVSGAWNTDSRIHIRADSAAGPVTVQGIMIEVETREGLSAPRRDK